MADERQGTELEDASTPHLDDLAAGGVTGLLEPVGPGITPGSGPGHLALFGYDPVRFVLGRGALSAAGLDVPLHPGDVAARGNLCTLDAEGTVVDRRAGRIADEEGRRVVARLNEASRRRGVPPREGTSGARRLPGRRPRSPDHRHGPTGDRRPAAGPPPPRSGGRGHRRARVGHPRGGAPGARGRARRQRSAPARLRHAAGAALLPRTHRDARRGRRRLPDVPRHREPPRLRRPRPARRPVGAGASPREASRGRGPVLRPREGCRRRRRGRRSRGEGRGDRTAWTTRSST